MFLVILLKDCVIVRPVFTAFEKACTPSEPEELLDPKRWRERRSSLPFSVT